MATICTFRKDKNDGEIVAVFAEPWMPHGYDLTSYAHIGQHGPISYDYYRERTTPAEPDEAADLLDELRAIGYDDLKIVDRLPLRTIWR